MYWIFKPKKYDPTPYSRILRFKHRVFGCPIETGEFYRRGKYHHIACPCGVAWATEVEKNI